MSDAIGADWTPDQRCRLLERLPEGAVVVDDYGMQWTPDRRSCERWLIAGHGAWPVDAFIEDAGRWPVRILLPATPEQVEKMMEGDDAER